MVYNRDDAAALRYASAWARIFEAENVAAKSIPEPVGKLMANQLATIREAVLSGFVAGQNIANKHMVAVQQQERLDSIRAWSAREELADVIVTCYYIGMQAGVCFWLTQRSHSLEKGHSLS